jgi:hypothetical protein
MMRMEFLHWIPKMVMGHTSHLLSHLRVQVGTGHPKWEQAL